jgi:hypothetical protein
MVRPRAYLPIYEAAQPNGVCGEREARVGVLPVCDHWSSSSSPAKLTYPCGLQSLGVAYTRAQPASQNPRQPGARTPCEEEDDTWSYLP